MNTRFRIEMLEGSPAVASGPKAGSCSAKRCRDHKILINGSAAFVEVRCEVRSVRGPYGRKQNVILMSSAGVLGLQHSVSNRSADYLARHFKSHSQLPLAANEGLRLAPEPPQ